MSMRTVVLCGSLRGILGVWITAHVDIWDPIWRLDLAAVSWTVLRFCSQRNP